MEPKQVDDHVRRVREKLLAKKGDTQPHSPKTKKQLKKEQRQQQREALRKHSTS